MGKDINDRVIGENEPLEFIREEPKKKPKVITYEGVMAKRCASAVAMAALSVAIIVTAFVYGRGDDKIDTDEGYKTATTTTTTTVTTTSPTVLGGENSESETTVTTPADSEEVVVTTTVPKTESEAPKTTTVPSVTEEKVTTTTKKATEKPTATTVTTTKKTEKSTTTKAPTTTTKKPTVTTTTTKKATTTTTKKQTTTTTTTKKQTTTTTTTKKQTTTTTTTKKPASQSSLTASANVTGGWNDGVSTFAQVDVSIKNNGSSAKSGWTVTLTFNRNVTVSQFWNCSVTANGKTLTIKPDSNSYNNGEIQPNQSGTFGLIVSGGGEIKVNSISAK